MNVSIYKTFISFAVLVFLANCSLSSQASIIKGNVSYISSNEPLDSLKIYLLDSNFVNLDSVTLYSFGSYKFKNLERGIYKICTKFSAKQDQCISNILLDGKDEKIIDFRLKDPCLEDKSNGKCPYCESKRHVIPTSPGTIVQYNFGGDISKAEKAWEKVEKKGYETYINKEGEEMVIKVFIESEYEKFWDYCNHWFCKRCKKVF